jgi:trans-aconitate methyltransferase
MERRPATDVFHDWALRGKDEGMERGHAQSVAEMIDFISVKSEQRGTSFSAVDVGCGNGWVVRILADIQLCQQAIGIDGAKAMIEKAKSIDRENQYIFAGLPNYSPMEKFDYIHSMEFLYYLEEPEKMLQVFYDDWLKEGGWAVIGIDHYMENEDSLSWPEHVGVNMATRTTNQWEGAWKKAGFNNVEHWIAGGKEGVTLVFVGQKC